MNRSISNHFGLSGKWLSWWLMVVNATSMLLFGYDQGVFGKSLLWVTFLVDHHCCSNFTDNLPGGILTLRDFETRFQLRGDETLKGVIVGSYDLGCLGGALATGPIGGLIGRKRSILFGTTIMMVGAFLQSLAPGFSTMTAGRSASYIQYKIIH